MSNRRVCKTISDFSEEEKKGAFVSLEESRKRRNPEKHKDIVLFDLPKFKCAKCSDVIWSKTEGQYVSCSCGAIAVDYTRYYGRQIGNQEDFISVKED